ncbi:MAG: DUF3866 family protein [Actinomycetota bacterium]|nr:DUF3866 family protein [Actinomycetota bacterium]
MTGISSERQGLQRVELDSGRPAYVLTELIGPVAVGDRVVVNTTAVDLGLGTGGSDVVHWNLARGRWSSSGGGRVMKLRYTSLQVDTGAAEESEGYRPPPSLGTMPVVACSLHSQVPCVAAAFKHLAPERRLAYVMTDGGALPLALSDVVAAMCGAGVVDATVTAGQAFGGHYEAVNVASALHVAKAAAQADAVVVGTGPGVVGTGTKHGTSALEVASVVDLAGRAGGRPVVALRHSGADHRPRHRGLSHHSLTALEYAHEAAVLPVPRGQVGPPGWEDDVVEVDVPDVSELAAAHGLRLDTMGRDVHHDPLFFAYAAAAGVVAASISSPP